METLIVVGIIVFLALISVPLFREQQQTTKLKTDARTLLTDLRLAQQRTVAEQATYLVKLFSSPDSYQVIKRSGGDTIIKTRNLTTGITWQDLGSFTNQEVVFTSNGAVVEAGSIILKNTNNQTATVEIKPSGYVKTN